MATYYLSTSTGNDSWTGLSATYTSGTTGPWKTLAKALGATGIASGDILYIAPGNYNESVTIGFSPSASTQIIGDPNSQFFGGINAGPVLISAFNAAGTSETVTANLIIAANRNYFEWSNIWWKTTTARGVSATNSRYWKFTNCVFENTTTSTSQPLFLSSVSATALDATITRCRFEGGQYSLQLTGGNVSDTTTVTSCVFNGGTEPIELGTIQVAITNCTFLNYPFGITQRTGSLSFVTTVRNCVWVRCASALQSNTAGHMTENYNRFLGASRTNMGTLGANSTTGGDSGLDIGYLLQTNGNYLQTYASYASSPNTAFGTATSAPATDLYNVAWNGASPDAGGITYRVITSLPSQVAYNGGIERNASTITIAPGSTSQSIELYLGATGLTASTAGLSAYYNRTRSADVQINMQARNITQNWTSGGFAEVNPNTMPGVYRLDIPNEALASGADDVTVVVRGASGTNGAVMSIKLSSGGLTTAQTASAVWNALTNDHTTHGTFGWNVLRADQDSKEGLVTLHQSGGVSRVDADVHAVVNDTAAATAFKGALLHDGTGYVDSDVVRISTSAAAANELEGALLHNGTDYIDSNLVGGNSTRVFVGRFQMTQTGTTQGDIIEAFTTDTPAFELQLFDGDNNLVPVTGATLGLRILDVTSTVVETGTPTIEYGTGGIVRWTAPGTYLSIGCPAGMYRLFVDRTVSGTTTTFGPLQIKVQVQ